MCDTFMSLLTFNYYVYRFSSTERCIRLKNVHTSEPYIAYICHLSVAVRRLFSYIDVQHVVRYSARTGHLSVAVRRLFSSSIFIQLVH